MIYKLLGFTLGMICIPIGSYFASVNVVFGGRTDYYPCLGVLRALRADILPGNATYAGAFAAIMANVVLVAYIIVAMKEDQSDRLEAESKLKKAQ